MADIEYAGFWIRVVATLIDTVLMLIITVPILTLIYNTDYGVSKEYISGLSLDSLRSTLVNAILPAVAIILFWFYKSATPGKMITKLRIIDAKTGGKPSIGQLVIRYLGYYVAIVPLFLGVIWIVIDNKNQGWHDKLAGTVVIKNSTKVANQI